MDAEKFEDLKREIKQRESKKIRLEGELETYKKELKSMGFSDLSEAVEEMEKLSKRINRMESNLKDELYKLEEEYGLGN